ncbi:hypothetical protein LD001_26815 [Pseudomonas kurunegalensis]|uniref:hypothetical protein n=1 Tax=Pseudomonas kurunegalensis TaxID=485880 RepID=UPI001CDB6F02|nr:hypothetical protein [Pseudomonas kurunegalensis]MCA4078857.1 hypothetical protein [Pseudomonas kurunegalensis]
MGLGWRKLVALPIAGLVLIGQSLIGYVTENGKLPDWMPAKLSGLGGLLASEISLSAWMLILIVVGVGSAIWWFLMFQTITFKGYEERIKLMGDELASCKARTSSLTEKNIELGRQLEARSVQEVKEGESVAEFDVNSLEFRTLAAIAVGVNHNLPVTLSYLKNALKTSNIEALAAIDILSASGLVSSSITGRGRIFKLTAPGRAFIVRELKG